MQTDPIQACAELVARGDPDRFRATMAAPVEARRKLFPLYAFNLEVARAPWASSEPMIAEMRLQFWRDVIEDASVGKTRAHEVAEPFARLVAATHLSVDDLDKLVSARRWDIYKDPFEDEAAFARYIDWTAGGLMWLAGKCLGAGADHETTLRAHGQAAGLAAFLVAVPELESRGRIPLVDGRPDAVAALARKGLDNLREATGATLPRPLHPAVWAGWKTQRILRTAAETPSRVAQGMLEPSPFLSHMAFLKRTVLGRL